MATTLRGLTWDHPRAWQGLFAVTERFHASQTDVRIVWERHSLRAFEATPIETLAARYDLITFDHPFIGDAVAAECLRDLTPFAAALDLADIAADSAGPSCATYFLAGGQWALPIDAACQTAVARGDLLERLGEQAPGTLEEAVRFGERHGLGLALAVPHAFMNHLTICSLLGADIGGDGERLVERHIAVEAIVLQRRLVASVPKAAFGWSSIGLLDAMATTDQVPWSPMVFCFNTYARPDRAAGLRALRFHDVPGLASARNGPVIGGAGLAISAACMEPTAAVTALAFLLSRGTQRDIAIAGGQPGRLSAWADPDADRANGGFFSGCLPSLTASAVRPRYAGYMTLQDEAGDILRHAMADPGMQPDDVAEQIDAAHRAARANGAGRRRP